MTYNVFSGTLNPTHFTSRPYNPNGKWIGSSVQPFLHSLRHKVPIMYNGRPYPPELPFPMGDLDLPCNIWCFGPMRAHNPSGTSIGSAVFAQMTAECPYTGLPVSPSELFLPISISTGLLWLPYGIGQTVIFLPCDFYLSSSFFFSSPNLTECKLDVYHTLRSKGWIKSYD